MRLRRECLKERESRGREKPGKFSKLKKFGKRLAKYAIIPAAALALNYAPMAKEANPFHSKPAMAQESPMPSDNTGETSEKVEVKNKSKWKIGGEFASNETGAAVSGTADLFDGMMGANIGYLSYYGGVQTPFFTIKGTPHGDFNGFKMFYNGSFMFANLNSWMYTYQMAGMGYNAELPHDLKINFGVIGGGALSYPQFDNIHFKMNWGLSFGWKNNIAVYGIVETYFAANSAIKASNVFDYGIRFQSVEAGIVGKYKKVFGVAFGKYDVIQSFYGGKVGVTLEFTDRVTGNLWVGSGVSRYTDYLAGNLNFMLLAGMSMDINSAVNTEWKMSHEQYGPGGTPMLPEISNPPYEQPISPDDTEAEIRVKSIDNFDDFTQAYEGASEEESINAARWLSRTIGAWGYAFDVMNDLYKMDFFSSNVQWLADTDYQDIYNYTHDLLNLLDVYGNWSSIPGDIRNYFENGIAMCSGIHSLTAKFLDGNGIHALAVAVSSKGGPHVVTLGMTDEMTFIIDYGDWYQTNPKSMAEILATYARFNNAPTFYSQMFHPDDGYIGTYTTDEARLLEKVMDADQNAWMKSFILDLPGH